MSEKQNGKIMDMLKTHFMDEKKMTEADAKNSATVIEERKNISSEYRALARNKETPLADKEYYLDKASAEMDKAQAESTAVRESNERRSVRKNYALAAIFGTLIGYIAPKACQYVKEELPKLLPRNKK